MAKCPHCEQGASHVGGRNYFCHSCRRAFDWPEDFSATGLDMVNSPPHYRSSNGIEAIDVIEAFGLGFHLGAAVKYLLRAGKKGDAVEDLRKCRWFIDRAIAQRSAPAPRVLRDIPAESSLIDAIDAARARK